jgi:hypothetical protein
MLVYNCLSLSTTENGDRSFPSFPLLFSTPLHCADQTPRANNRAVRVFV